MNKPYHCPKCKKDLRKVGISAIEYGTTKHWLRYNKEGNNDRAEIYNSEADEYTIRCANCETKLDLTLEDVWDILPKKIKTAKELF